MSGEKGGEKNSGIRRRDLLKAAPAVPVALAGVIKAAMGQTQAQAPAEPRYRDDIQHNGEFDHLADAPSLSAPERARILETFRRERLAAEIIQNIPYFVAEENNSSGIVKREVYEGYDRTEQAIERPHELVLQLKSGLGTIRIPVHGFGPTSDFSQGFDDNNDGDEEFRKASLEEIMRNPAHIDWTKTSFRWERVTGVRGAIQQHVVLNYSRPGSPTGMSGSKTGEFQVLAELKRERGPDETPDFNIVIEMTLDPISGNWIEMTGDDPRHTAYAIRCSDPSAFGLAEADFQYGDPRFDAGIGDRSTVRPLIPDAAIEESRRGQNGTNSAIFGKIFHSIVFKFWRVV